MSYETEHYSVRIDDKGRFPRRIIKINYILLEDENEWNVPSAGAGEGGET